MKSLVPVCKVPALIEAWYGWRPHEMTVYRWTKGVHDGKHQLRTIKRGSRRLTSHGELRRFMREWSGEPAIEPKKLAARERRSNQSEHERAMDSLRKMGLKL